MTMFRTYLAVIFVGFASLLLVTCSSENKTPTNTETTSPRVVATFPSPGATQIPTTTTITVTFSEPIDPNSVSILIGGLVRGPISVTDSIVTLTLNNRLFQKNEYVAVVPAGVKDRSGNRMDSAYVWSFTTGFSPLGEQWTPQASPTSGRLNDVDRGSYEFLAVGAAGTMLISEDGFTWNPLPFQPIADQLWSTFPIGDRFVVAGSPATVIACSDLYSWTQDRLDDSITNLYDMWVAFDGIYMVGTGGVSGTDGLIVKYIAPTNWTTVNLGPGRTPRSITRFGANFVVVGDSGLVFTSADGITWDDHSLGSTWGSLEKVRWVGQSGKLIAVGSAIISSTDGINWLQQTPKSTTLLRDVEWTTLTVRGTTYSFYCAVGDAGTIYTSEDGISWTSQNAGVTNDLYGIGHGLVPARFVVVGEGGIILTSE